MTFYNASGPLQKKLRAFSLSGYVTFRCVKENATRLGVGAGRCPMGVAAVKQIQAIEKEAIRI